MKRIGETKGPGAPPKMHNGRRRNVYIDDASWARAEVLGNGNASDGIRIALLQLKTATLQQPNEIQTARCVEPSRQIAPEKWSRTLSGEPVEPTPLSGSVVRLGGTSISKKVHSGLLKKAQVWRADNNFVGRGGIITFYRKKAAGWSSDMREPHRWEPGVIALDEDGRAWVTAGGEPQNGAKRWEPVSIR